MYRGCKVSTSRWRKVYRITGGFLLAHGDDRIRPLNLVIDYSRLLLIDFGVSSAGAEQNRCCKKCYNYLFHLFYVLILAIVFVYINIAEVERRASSLALPIRSNVTER